MSRTAVFPGSFDPFTLGHLDVLKHALDLFDKVYIAVGVNVQKRPLFSIEARIAMIKEAVKQYPNVEVLSYSGMTVEFCKKHNIKYIFRGLRTTTDFEMETVIAQVNEKIDSSIKTIFIPCGAKYSFISSTVVRDILQSGGDATDFIPEGIDLNKYLNLN